MKKILSLFLSVILVISLFPLAYAAQSKPAGLNIISQVSSTLAPGITQDIVCSKIQDTGEQIMYYVATADTTRDDVTLNATYKGAQWDTWGLATIPDQMAAAEAAHSDPASDRYIPNYTAVAGVNGAYYNMSTGQPEGAFAMEGHIIQDAGSRPFFAILKDGTPVIGFNSSDWNRYKNDTENPVWEAVSGHIVQVKDGQKAAGLDSKTLYPRISVGITADNKVVLVASDGWNAPTSVGATMSQMADILLANGCVNGLELDGGGSATYVARQEGDDKLSVVNKPSDGSPRATSNGLMIVSTTPPSDVFDRAVLTAEHSYVTPGSTVKIETTGVSPAGTPADIPTDAFLQLADSSFGTVSNGTFVSNGTAGDAVVQMVCEGRVVGDTTIHVVIPSELVFKQDSMVVPYGKTIPLNITAYYNLNEVILKNGDVEFALSEPSAGTVNGFYFTASESEYTTGTNITASCTFDSSIAATAAITLGRGSEVLFDFEDGQTHGFDLSDNKSNPYNYYLPDKNVSVVTAANGQVHSGQYSLALNMDYSNSFESGYQRLSLFFKDGDSIYREGATKLGMWIYVPDENVSLKVRWQYVSIAEINEDGTYTVDAAKNFGIDVDGMDSFTPGWVGTLEESGWHYLSIDLSGYKGAALRSNNFLMQFYICDRDGEKYNYYFKDQSNVNGSFTFYIDDITVDYSDAVDDREAPIFSELNYAAAGAADAAAIAKDSVPTASTHTLDFAAKVQEDTKKSNATGLDPSSAKAYIDGNEVPCAYDNGAIRINSSQTLSNGIHTIKFSICDIQGNYASIIRQIKVQGGNAGVTVAAHDPTADRVPLGSVQYVDIVAPAGKEVQSVTTKLNLDAMNTWELEHMDVAAGYTASWSMTGSDAADRIATVTITRDASKDAAEADENGLVLASIPVRVWNLEHPVTVNGKEWTLKTFFAGNECWPVAIDVRVQQGHVVYADGTSDTFTGDNVFIWSECWANAANMKAASGGQAWWNNLAANGAHTHTSGEPTDKAPACTETGYANRVFCTACGSPVEWGETIPATGHTWSINGEDKLACASCGKLYSGEYEGKTYVDGVLIADGWSGDSYYQNGIKLTGIQCVDGKYYDFGTDGVCTDKDNGYTGFFEQNGKRYYAEFGELRIGWFSLLEERYHTGEDGALHTVTTWDDREGSCTKNGYIHYDCDCGQSQLSEAMWSEGHNWDENHVCTKCGKQGIDIAEAILEIDGTYFSYTGQEIRPDHTATYNGKKLNITSDRLGEDGYITYNNNREIGTGTITIEGRGDYYGELSGTFKIVPATVTNLTAVQQDENTLTIRWNKAGGADYYSLWQMAEGDDVWQEVNGRVEGTSYTLEGINPGTYTFSVASRAERNGEIYRSVAWSDYLQVTVTPALEINLTEAKNGAISTDPSGKARPGELVTITAVPDDGYLVRTVLVRDSSNAAVAVTRTEDGKYTFTMPDSPVTVSASFKAQGECEYLSQGPFRAQIQLSGLVSGRKYVCQMEKADPNGTSIGCAAIVVFTAADTTQLLDVLPNSSGGYLVSLWAYPDSGDITDIDDLSIAFYGQHVSGSAEIAALSEDSGEGLAPDDGEAIPVEDENTPENDDTVLGPHGECSYLAQGAFKAQLRLSGLVSGRKYVCQMQKADAAGTDIGCAAIVVFTATDDAQLLDVLPNNNGGYLVSLWAFPESGTITDITELSMAFTNQHVIQASE